MSTPAEPLWIRAEMALRERVSPMPVEAFWKAVAELGWSKRTQDPAACGAALAQRHSPEEVVAMRARLVELDGELQRSIASWEMQHQESLGLPLELQKALREHLIGLGETAYTEALRGPWRAQHRAEVDDYLEGFGRSFDEAMKAYPAEKLEPLSK